MKIVGLTIKIMMIINTLIYNRLQRFFFQNHAKFSDQLLVDP
jgi:hypothetical protein